MATLDPSTPEWRRALRLVRAAAEAAPGPAREAALTAARAFLAAAEAERLRSLARLLPPGLEAVEAPRDRPFSEFVRLVASCKAVVSNDTMQSAEPISATIVLTVSP